MFSVFFADNKTQEELLRTTQLVYANQAGKMVIKHQGCQFFGNSWISGFFQIFNDTVWPKNGFFRSKMAFFDFKKSTSGFFSHDPLASLDNIKMKFVLPPHCKLI